MTCCSSLYSAGVMGGSQKYSNLALALESVVDAMASPSKTKLTLKSCSSLLCCDVALLGFLFSLAILGLVDFHSNFSILGILGRPID